MATSSGYGRVNDSEIARLAECITVKGLTAVAVERMDISLVTIQNLEYENKGDAKAINCAVFRKWVNSYPGTDHRQRLAWILYQGAMDQEKVQEILEVTREEAEAIGEASGSSQQEITEEDVEDIAEGVKEYMENKMKIGMAPWVKNYTVKMEDLYTELTIEKIEKEPSGPHRKVINDYKELFVNAKSAKVTQSGDAGNRRFKRFKSSGDKVLVKADPGMGKSTLARKMGWDWAKGFFTLFSIVFFVSLKLIKPGDAIENIIIQQCPPLQSQKVTPQDLRKLLDTFGNRCLIILDGYDELDGQNISVLKLIKSENLSQCSILVTSRPHCSAEIEEHFRTIVEIQGFGKIHTEEFVPKILVKEDKIQAVLSFNAENFVNTAETYTCPMILLFICILVDADEIDLTRKNVALGEIYWRLVRCIYRKYCVRKGFREFRDDEFEKVLDKIGRLASEALLSEQSCFKRSEIIEKIGEDAFAYGLLIGHEDFRLQADETADIFVTFVHKTVQEFCGAFHAIKLAGWSDDRPHLILMNSNVFQFCLGILQVKEIDSAVKISVQSGLQTLFQGGLNLTTLDYVLAGIHTESLRIRALKSKNDKMLLDFYNTVLLTCSKVKRLVLSVDDPIEWMLEAFGDNVSQLTSVQILDRYYTSMIADPLGLPLLGSGLTLVLLLTAQLNPKLTIDEVLAQCSRVTGHPSLFLMGKQLMGTFDISPFMRQDIRKLCFMGSVLHGTASLNIKHSIQRCSYLTHLFLINFTIESSVLSALSKAMQRENLPCLTHLSFADSKTSLKGKLSLLFQSVWPTLVHLNLNKCQLGIGDLGTIGFCFDNRRFPKLESLVLDFGDAADSGHGNETSSNDNGSNDDVSLKKISFKIKWQREIDTVMFPLFQIPWPSITKLWLHGVNKEEYKAIVAALNRTRAPNLTELGISMWKNVEVHKLEQIPVSRVDEHENWQFFLEINEIEYLDPVNVPTLTDLTLHRFICTMQHLYMVTKSTVLTKLHKLDISHSSGMTGTLSILLCHKFPSLNSLILSDCGLNSQDLCSLAQASAKGRLPELKHLDISHNGQLAGKLNNLFDKGNKWEKLLSLNVESILSSCFLYLSSMVQEGCLGALQELGVSVDEDISKSVDEDISKYKITWRSLKILQISSETCSMQVIVSAVWDLIKGGVFPYLESVPVKAQTTPERERAQQVAFDTTVSETLNKLPLDQSCRSKISSSIIYFPRKSSDECRPTIQKSTGDNYDKLLYDSATNEVVSIVEPLREDWSDSEYQTVIDEGRKLLIGAARLYCAEKLSYDKYRFAELLYCLRHSNVAVFYDCYSMHDLIDDWSEAGPLK